MLCFEGGGLNSHSKELCGFCGCKQQFKIIIPQRAGGLSLTGNILLTQSSAGRVNCIPETKETSSQSGLHVEQGREESVGVRLLGTTTACQMPG